MPGTFFGDILGLGTPELIVILVILLLLFGGRKLPELSRSIGSSISELRKGVKGDASKSETKSQTTQEKDS